MEYTFLTTEQVLFIHQDQIWRYGGDDTVRDMGLLHSAINMPMQSFGGEFVLSVAKSKKKKDEVTTFFTNNHKIQ